MKRVKVFALPLCLFFYKQKKNIVGQARAAAQACWAMSSKDEAKYWREKNSNYGIYGGFNTMAKV
jgi:poly-beta-hydroxyalkanoate depolymerase